VRIARFCVKGEGVLCFKETSDYDASWDVVSVHMAWPELHLYLVGFALSVSVHLCPMFMFHSFTADAV